MAVTNRLTAAGILLAALTAATSVASQEPTPSSGHDLSADLELIRLAKRDFNQAAANLQATIDACDRKAAANPVPVLKKVELTMLRAKPEDLQVGLGHLGSINRLECERDARLAMAFAAGNLTQLLNELQVPLAATEQEQQARAFQPTEQLRYRAQYAHLTPELKHYLETVIGSEPFDLPKTLAANGLVELSAPAVAQASAANSAAAADGSQPSGVTAAQ